MSICRTCENVGVTHPYGIMYCRIKPSWHCHCFCGYSTAKGNIFCGDVYDCSNYKKVSTDIAERIKEHE